MSFVEYFSSGGIRRQEEQQRLLRDAHTALVKALHPWSCSGMWPAGEEWFPSELTNPAVGAAG